MASERREGVAWKSRLSWGGFALLVALLALWLTLLITHVDHGAHANLAIVFDEQHPLRVDLTRVKIGVLERARFAVPAVIFADVRRSVLLVTPSTSAVTIANVRPASMACNFVARPVRGTALEAAAEEAPSGAERPVALAPAGDSGTSIAVPPALHAAIAGVPGARGAIGCTLAGGPVAASPTFTERSITLHVRNLRGGYAIVDVSALEGIDNLRFSGGVTMPFAGDRTRLLDPTDDIVSIEWVDVAAAERRDVILVTIGALAAIAAAMAIEAIRPFVER